MKRSMKQMLFLAVALVAGLPSLAAAAPRVVNAKDYTCKELKAIVQAEGVIIHKGWLGAEQVYVANSSYCTGDAGALALPAYDVSKDTKFCQVGGICEGSIYDE